MNDNIKYIIEEPIIKKEFIFNERVLNVDFTVSDVESIINNYFLFQPLSYFLN